MILRKRFDISPPDWGCSERLDVLIFLFKNILPTRNIWMAYLAILCSVLSESKCTHFAGSMHAPSYSHLPHNGALPDCQARAGTGNIFFSCLADHDQDWQPYPVDA